MANGRFSLTVLCAFTIVVYIFMLAPVFVIVLLSFDTAEYAGFPLSGWTLKWYADLIHDSAILAALRTSLILGVYSSVISTLIGTAAAFAIARFRFIGRQTVQVFLTLPILVPHIVLGVGLLMAFRMAGLLPSFPLLVVGHVAFTLPFVLLTTLHRLQSIPRAYEEAARTLGANQFHTFREVTLPLTLPAVAAGMLFAFMMSFDEVTATLFWLPANTQTVQTHVLGMLEYSISQTLNALAAILILFSVALPLVGMLLARRMAGIDGASAEQRRP